MEGPILPHARPRASQQWPARQRADRQPQLRSHRGDAVSQTCRDAVGEAGRERGRRLRGTLVAHLRGL